MQKRRYGLHCNLYGYVRMRITETAGTVSEANKTVYAVAGVASATPADISPSYLTEGHNYAGNWFKNLWKSARYQGFLCFQPFVIIA